VDRVRRCDAVVLQWATDQWYAPYKGQPALCRHMLQQHLMYGCDSHDEEIKEWFYDLVYMALNALSPPKSEIREIRSE
jgi:hypothetical protein